MRKNFVALCLFIFAGLLVPMKNAFGYALCNPNNVVLPCTSPENVDMDSFIGVSDRIAFYTTTSTTANGTEDPYYWNIYSIPPVNGHAQYYFWSPTGDWDNPNYSGGNMLSSFLKSDPAFIWIGVGAFNFGHFRYATSYTVSNPDNWTRKKNSYGSLAANQTGGPHVAEDWNRGGGCTDRGLPIYAIANGTLYDKTDDSATNAWGRTVILKHDAPSSTYFLSGRGELLSTVYSMYAHVLRPGQTGYNSALDLDSQLQNGNPIVKGAPVGQVGDANGFYSGACHLHLEILTDPNSYRDAAYSWTELAHRTDPSELISNDLYTSSSSNFSITVHPYECSGTFGLNTAIPSCNGTATIGNWTRRGAGVLSGGLELGYSGIIFSKAANKTGKATWKPNLPKDGQYKVLVYIPQTAAGYSSATNASYTVSSNGTTYSSVIVNQSIYTSGGWAELGTYSLYQNGSSKVVLQGNTGESGKVVAVDAVRFQYVASIP